MVNTSLTKSTVGMPFLLAQSIASVAPMGAALGTLLGTAAYAGAAFPLSMIVGLLITLLWVNTPYQFSKKIVGAGGFYHFASEGVSPTFGSFDGWYYIANYVMFIAPGGLLIFGVVLPGILPILGITWYPTILWIPLSIVFIIIASALAYYGIKPSLKFSLVASILEIGFLLILSIVIITSSHTTNTLAVYSPVLSPDGFSGIFLGAIFALTAVGGVSSAVYLGEEARAPLKNVKIAVIVAYLVNALTFVLFSYAATVGWGISNMGAFANSGVPGIILAQQYMGEAGLIIISLLIVNSVFAAILAPINATSRLIHSMARDKVLPEWLSVLHPKRNTPSRPILILGVAAIFISTVLGLILGPLNAFIFIFLLAGTSALVAHVMGSAALPKFYSKIKALNPLYHVIGPILFIISAIGIGYSLFVPFVFPVYYAPLFIIAWSLFGGLIFFSARKRLSTWNEVGKSKWTETPEVPIIPEPEEE